MKTALLISIVESDFFSGVPDSLLKPLCDYLMKNLGLQVNHFIGANEGNCASIAAGYYLATGKIPVIYMQNSGIGNLINPFTSLLHEKVYGIPCIFIIGWRGEPGVNDEPQHVFQGEVTLKLLEKMGIKTFIVSKDTTEEELQSQMIGFKPLLEAGRSVALLVRQGAITHDSKIEYRNNFKMLRENVLKKIVDIADSDIIVSTTGKTSRELYEIREQRNQGHGHDFLTVGSMGHSSSIALGIAVHKPNTKVWCVDGDGALLMHMGAMAVIGANGPKNLVHVLINNGAHESVGGMPTVAEKIDFLKIAQGCGYGSVKLVTEYDVLDEVIQEAKDLQKLSFIEVRTAIASRSNLGRPTKTPRENKIDFMNYLRECN